MSGDVRKNWRRSQSAAPGTLPSNDDEQLGDADLNGINDIVGGDCMLEPFSDSTAEHFPTSMVSRELLQACDTRAETRADSRSFESALLISRLPVGTHPGFYSVTQADRSGSSSSQESPSYTDLFHFSDHSSLDRSEIQSRASLRLGVSSADLTRTGSFEDDIDSELGTFEQSSLCGSYLNSGRRPRTSLIAMAGSPREDEPNWEVDENQGEKKPSVDGVNTGIAQNKGDDTVDTESDGDVFELVEIEGPGFDDDAVFDKETTVRTDQELDDHFWD